jgi:hypothetical protein
MAGLGELLDPRGTPDAATNPTPQVDATGDLRKQWEGVLADPNGRAALMSFGLSLMQPMNFGQTPAGHFASSVGEAGSALRTIEAGDLKKQELDSKAGLREAQANLAGARAETAGARAGGEASRLELAREKLGLTAQGLDLKKELAGERTKAGLYSAYIKAQEGAKKRNADIVRLPGTPDEVLPPFPEWARGYQLGLHGLEGNPTEGDVTLQPPPVSATTKTYKEGDVQKSADGRTATLTRVDGKLQWTIK